MSDTIFPETKPGLGPSLADWAAAEGLQEAIEVDAVKAAIAWQLTEQMREQKISKLALAERMHTSRTQIHRLLDPSNANVQLSTLISAAAAMGRKLKIELV